MRNACSRATQKPIRHAVPHGTYLVRLDRVIPCHFVHALDFISKAYPGTAIGSYVQAGYTQTTCQTGRLLYTNAPPPPKKKKITGTKKRTISTNSCLKISKELWLSRTSRLFGFVHDFLHCRKPWMQKNSRKYHLISRGFGIWNKLVLRITACNQMMN